MKIFGLKWSALDFAGVQTALFFGAVAGAIGLVLMHFLGGTARHIVAMASAGFVASLIALAGASFDKAGLKGLLICAASTGVVYVAVIGLTA
ncbi:hypothetical protein [Duganella vulcania]|uniref:Uncharacterized protein n=1 Tax=Duganella vulcania TaxID=2692166 RepID=A0A845GG28_9BURK|nr:hypothetical protein [Duganella vulcania]MYM92335.1 hypothetical protein [Duganella vulcania]